MYAVLIALAVAFVDQATKVWVREVFDLYESVPVIPSFFSLTYIRNTGAAWGMFSGQNLLLTALGVVMMILLGIFHRRVLPPGRLGTLALGLLSGGIAGNVFDRLRIDYVVDFLDFHLAGHHFPAFNVADSAICIGVGIFLMASLMTRKPAVS